MAFVKFDSGVILTWDDTISVGSLIRTYNDGYHILTNIEFRDGPVGYAHLAMEWSNKELYPYTPLFHYTKVLKGDGTPSKAIKGSCDASYCFLVTKDWTETQRAQEVAQANAKADAILTFL